MAYYFLMKEAPLDGEQAIGFNHIAVPRRIPQYRYDRKIVKKGDQGFIITNKYIFNSVPLYVSELGIHIGYFQKKKIVFKTARPRIDYSVAIGFTNTSAKTITLNGKRLGTGRKITVDPLQNIVINQRQTIILDHESLLKSFLFYVFGLEFPDLMTKGLHLNQLLRAAHQIARQEGEMLAVVATHHQYREEYITADTTAEAGFINSLIKGDLYRTATELLCNRSTAGLTVLNAINSWRQDMPFGKTGDAIKEIATEARYHTIIARECLATGREHDDLEQRSKNIGFARAVTLLRKSFQLMHHSNVID